LRTWSRFRTTPLQKGAKLVSGLFLVAVFFLITVVGQTIAVSLGLLVERYVLE